MKYRLLLLALVLLFPFSCKTISDVAQNLPASEAELVILQINDVYEISPLEGGKLGGMARVATLRKQLKAKHPNVKTILAGDFLSPSVIGTVKIDGERVQGEQMVDVMNAIGIDAVVFGNHEFDIKEAALQKRLNESKFTWIGGNVWHDRGELIEPFYQEKSDGNKEWVKPYDVWVLPASFGAPVNLGVMALTINSNPQDFVRYVNYTQSAQQFAEDLRLRSDAMIAITHLSIEEDREVARLVPDLNLIMGGHEHAQHTEKVGEVTIAKADANAKSAWVHHLKISGPDHDISIKSEAITLDEKIEPDPEVSKLVESWEKKAFQAFIDQGFDLEAEVADLDEPLDGLEAHIRTRQTNLGLAIATGMFEAADGADCAVFNGGSVRIDDHLSGTITQYDIIRTLPFGGKVLQVDMKGRLLKKALDSGEKNKGNGGYLQRHLLSKESGEWQLKGESIADDQTYRVALNDYLLLGLEDGMEYFTRKNEDIVAAIEPEADSPLSDVRKTLVNYLQKQ
ncbi:MAG: bifunctional metallophosphatase/5'-nucleotidase [Bacteroidota bacterium]